MRTPPSSSLTGILQPLTIAYDTTENKRSEEALKESEQRN